jgi:hypothetical protein
MKIGRGIIASVVFAASSAVLLNAVPAQGAGQGPSAEAKRIMEYWTKARRDGAIPRDLVIDERGLGYLRKPDGSLEPYGHSVAAANRPVPASKPIAGDSTPPVISEMTPANGATIGTSATFSAKVTDSESSVRSVTFVIVYPSGQTQSFSPSAVGNDTWEIGLQGFSNGNWGWQVIAKDNGEKGGNTATSTVVQFTVDTSSSAGGGENSGSNVVTNAVWSDGGTVQTAAGRIYFEMPANAKRKGPWTAYVCSGTVATDGTPGRSVVITAAHCVYDDVNQAFARNVLFIPDQAGTSGSGTDTNCGNDPMGCWAPAFGVVDVNWTDPNKTFPANIPWDYAYYVVSDAGAHKGAAATSDSLDAAAGSLEVDFTQPSFDDGVPAVDSPDFTYALGYSYSNDPNFMYCAEDMTIEGSYGDYWLASCGLSGGSSGGPWMQPMVGGNGPIISVNSWGYTNSPGMAGPRLAGNSAERVFTIAGCKDFGAVSTSDGEAGVAVDSQTSCP